MVTFAGALIESVTPGRTIYDSLIEPVILLSLETPRSDEYYKWARKWLDTKSVSDSATNILAIKDRGVVWAICGAVCSAMADWSGNDEGQRKCVEYKLSIARQWMAEDL